LFSVSVVFVAATAPTFTRIVVLIVEAATVEAFPKVIVTVPDLPASPVTENATEPIGVAAT